jgi:hypothetical protein
VLLLLLLLLQIMYLMALDEFMNGGPDEGDSSYHGIAAIHGGSQSYNGARPGGEGCATLRVCWQHLAMLMLATRVFEGLCVCSC